jgi:HEAT repeat protein
LFFACVPQAHKAEISAERREAGPATAPASGGARAAPAAEPHGGDGELEHDIEALGDAQSAREEQAVQRIAGRGRSAVPRLLQELERDRLGGIGRARILSLLARAGAPEALPALLAALHDPRAVTRAAAIDAVSAFSKPSATAALVALLSDPDPDTVTQAALRLADRHQPETTQPLGKLLLREEQGIRFAAVRALSRIGTPEAQQLLRAHLPREGDAEVRSVILGADAGPR